jgi:hypothetical protein
MRRLLLLLTTLALIATACGSDGSSTPQDAAAQATEAAANITEDLSDDDAADADSDAEAMADDEAEAAAPAGDTASEEGPTCGFGDDLTVESVEIAQIDGDERDTNPSALVGAHPDFPEPLIDPDAIISGGPPPDGIPPIDSPRFQTAGSVDWLQCTEPVLSLVVDGDARAYPIQIMTWHEIVNDTFTDVPVTVSFCPLCNSALVYRRDVADRILDFGTSGRLFNSSLVMYDRQTESLWTHFNGKAVVGSLAGTELELLAVQTTSWENFLRQNPEGIVLTRDTGFQRSYGRNPYEGYDNTNDNPFLFRGDLDERLAAKERVVSIGIGEETAAIVLDHLIEEEVLTLNVGGRDLTIWHLPGTNSALDSGVIADGRDIGTVGVYLPAVDGQALSFTRNGDGMFVDAETGSTWDIGGVAIDGEFAGTRLEAVEHLDTFWFAIAAFEPDTRIVQ